MKNKKISKVVAISMASAMAMSSLSAALVNVSATTSPTLANTGTVAFADTTVSGNKKPLEAIVTTLGGDDAKNSTVDAIVGKTFDLTGNLDSLVKLKYTDSEGITQDVDDVKVTYRISSGTSYASVSNKDSKYTLTAKKSGTATLQIKATGTVDLGDSKKAKDVTFTQNITVNVHADNELGLVSTADDLQDLAAYDASGVTFKVVTYKAIDGKFYAKVQETQIGDSSTTDRNPDGSVVNPKTVAKVQAVLNDKTVFKNMTDEGRTLLGQCLTEALSQDKNTGTISFNSDKYKELLKVTGNDTKTIFNAVKYDAATAQEDLDRNATDLADLTQKPQTLDNNTLYKATVGGKDVYFTAKNAVPLGNVADILKDDTASNTNKYNPADGTVSASGTVDISCYTLKDEAALANVVRVPECKFNNENAVKFFLQLASKKADGNGTTTDSSFALTASENILKDYVKESAKAQLVAKGNNLVFASMTDFDAQLDTLMTYAAGTGLTAGKVATATDTTTQFTAGGETAAVPWSEEEINKAIEAKVTATAAQKTYLKVGNEVYTNEAELKEQVYDSDAIDSTATPQTIAKKKAGDNVTIVEMADASLLKTETATTGQIVQNYSAKAKKLTPKDTVSGGGDASKLTEENLKAAKVVKITSGSDVSYYALEGTLPSGADVQENGKDCFSAVEGAETKLASKTPSVYLSGWEVIDNSKAYANYGLCVAETQAMATKFKTPKKKVDGKKFSGLFADSTADAGQDKVSLEQLASDANSKAVAAAQTKVNELMPAEGGNKPAGRAAQTLTEGKSVTSVRFYAGTGAELFEQTANTNGTGKWEKGTKSGKNGVTVSENAKAAALELKTKGSVGTGSVKALVTITDSKNNNKTTTEEYTLNVKTVKAVDFGNNSVEITKTGGKVLASSKAVDDTGNLSALKSKSISGYELRTSGTDGSVTVNSGNVGVINAGGSVDVKGGKTGNIIGGTSVTVTNATVGNVDVSNDVSIKEGSSAGTITTDGGVEINDGTSGAISAGGKVEVKGGTVNGSVAGAAVTVSASDENSDGKLMDVTITGDVISDANGAKTDANATPSKIEIDNQSDAGKTTLTIGGSVIAKFADSSSEDASVAVGSSDTTGAINIGGAVQGERIKLGGNGLVTLGGVRASTEVDRGDEEGKAVESTLEFEGFNSGINAVTGFATVKVSGGTARVVNALNTTTLELATDSQLVADKGLTVEDISGDGSIVAPVGAVRVNGSVSDSPTLALVGAQEVGTVLYTGDRGLTDAFKLGGTTVTADRQANGTYNYSVAKYDLNGLTAVGKNVVLGKKQAKEVSVVSDAALPQGASIQWKVADSDIATVTPNGNSATITGMAIGNTEVTAKIVDSTGKELGYDAATFSVDVLSINTADVVGSEVKLDTTSKNLQVGQSYNFLVKDVKDADNIKISYNSEIVNVALANADYNGRGVLYTITAKANGNTNVDVSYKGATASIAVKVGGFSLDTASKTMGVGQTYSFLARNVKIEDAAGMKFTYDNTVAKVDLANANYNGRGALFTVTALKEGSTEIKTTYNNEEATLKLDVKNASNKLTLDTASYTMPQNGAYTIGVKVEQNGKQLSGAEVKALFDNGTLRVRDSRTGTIIKTPEVLATGNIRVTGKATEGTTYVIVEAVQNGQVATRASVGVTVKAGATPGGIARRSVSEW